MSDHGEDKPRFGKYILAAVLFYIALFGFYLRFAPSEDSGGGSSVSTQPEPLGQTDLSPIKPSDSGISAARETTSSSKAKPSYTPHSSTSNYSYPYPDMEFDGYDVCFVNKKSPKSEGKFPSFVLGIPQFRKVA